MRKTCRDISQKAAALTQRAHYTCACTASKSLQLRLKCCSKELVLTLLNLLLNSVISVCWILLTEKETHGMTYQFHFYDHYLNSRGHLVDCCITFTLKQNTVKVEYAYLLLLLHILHIPSVLWKPFAEI